MSYRPHRPPDLRAQGWSLKLLVALVESPWIGSVLARKTLRDAGIDDLRRLPCDTPPPQRHVIEEAAQPELPDSLDEPSDASLLEAGCLAGWETAGDLLAAYRESRTCPGDVADRLLLAVEDEDTHPPLGAFVAIDGDDLRAGAAAAGKRWAAQAPIGPLDGIAIPVKDEIDCRPYTTRVGTCFLGAASATEDAETVRRLRRAGALPCGKTQMHEIGMGVLGINPHHGTARNPWDRRRATGGSSSGSAAAVAAGLAPFALGADGGGSIRIPASLCGLIGLKATWGRISERGAAPLCWSVAHLGPLAASARDAALAYRLLAGEDPLDPATHHRPPVHLHGFFHGLEGVKIGVDRPYFEDADPDVVAVNQGLLASLAEAGAEIREIELPDPHRVRVVHLVTILGEMAAAHLRYAREHGRDYGHDIRLVFNLVRRQSPGDYVHAQRHRAAIAVAMRGVFEEVDLVATPSTACTAPLLPGPSGLATGLFDMALTERLMRFSPLANLTGLPAISIPSGYDRQGLPVGFQLLAGAWNEALLLRAARIAEETGNRRTPPHAIRLLD